MTELLSSYRHAGDFIDISQEAIFSNISIQDSFLAKNSILLSKREEGTSLGHYPTRMRSIPY